MPIFLHFIPNWTCHSITLKTGCSGPVHWDDPEGWGKKIKKSKLLKYIYCPLVLLWIAYSCLLLSYYGDVCFFLLIFKSSSQRCVSGYSLAAAAAKLLQSCPTPCDPIGGSPPGFVVPGILQARTLEWVAISFSNAWKLKVKVKSLSCVQLFATPWTAARQAPPSMEFSRQECWSGVPLPSPSLASTAIILPYVFYSLLNYNIWEKLYATVDLFILWETLFSQTLSKPSHNALFFVS